MKKGVCYNVFIIMWKNEQKTYYQRNRDVILNRAKDYYKSTKERLRNNVGDKYRNLSQEGKNKKKKRNKN